MMTKGFRIFLGGLAMSASLAAAAAAQDVIIGTYGDPTPSQWAAEQGKFAEATGWNVDWRKFASGADVIAAMASGSVQVAELGSAPFAIAATQGVDIEAFMLDYVIGASESLIVRNGSGIEKLEDLKGKRVAVPIGSTAHFSLMGALEHAGLGPRDVTVMGMPPDQITAAWQQDAIDAAFVWPPAQTEILANGKRLVGADDVAAWGYPTFNVWVVNKDFAAANKDALIAFIKANDDAIMAYLADPAAWTAEKPEVQSIAKQTGAAADQVPEILQGYKFLSLSDQLKPEWFGGGLAEATKKTADFLKAVGRLNTANDDYSSSVTDAYLKEAAQ